MLKGLICPDNERITRDECITKCRMGRRCLTLPTIYATSKDREWQGKPSTTQLLQPFRLSYLKIKHDYYVRPEDRAFQILGVRAHAVLELNAKLAGLMNEMKLQGRTDITGILDLLEPDEQIENGYVLTDYKTWASAKIKNFTPQDQTVFQLNHYRLIVDEILSPGYVTRMQIQIIVRDGGTQSAYVNKVTKRIATLEIPFMQNQYIQEYFDERAAKLLSYINGDTLPPVCDENWNWKRCKDYCECFEFCPEGRRIHNLPQVAKEQNAPVS